jgi:NAD(P)-dependent dehydrogenase (short-subunit alcohol dehydrogenase family)
VGARAGGGARAARAVTHDAAMHDKICLVTGATSGIGRVTARELARMGGTVVAVARDRARGEAAVAEFAEAGGRPAELLVGDLSVQADVRRVAAEFLRRHPRLDVLVNNAGAIHNERELTADGIERTFAVNHLAYFLLTTLLLPALEAAPAGRVVSVSSEAHRGVRRLDFANLQSERRYTAMGAYSQSKLENVLFTYELARRLGRTRVTANCLHPGVIRSGFGRNNGGVVGALFALAAPLLASPEKGARTTIHLASSPRVEGTTGRYFRRERPAASSPASYDADAARRLWEVSEALTRGSRGG